MPDRTLLKLVEEMCLVRVMNLAMELKCAYTRSSSAKQWNCTSVLCWSSLISAATGTWALGITRHFQWLLLASLLKELLLTARKAQNLPNLSCHEFICEATSEVEGILWYYWQPVTAVMWGGWHPSAKEPAICVGAGWHLASSAAQRHPSSRASRLALALDPLQILLNCARSLRLASRYKANQRGPARSVFGQDWAQLWPCERVRGQPKRVELYQRQSPPFATCCISWQQGLSLFYKYTWPSWEAENIGPKGRRLCGLDLLVVYYWGI